jgi:hypothetical protein
MKKGVDAPEQNGGDSKRQRTSEVGVQEAAANQSLFSRIYVAAWQAFFGLVGETPSSEPLSAEEIAIRDWVSNAGARTHSDQTVLHLAAREGRLDAVRWLLQNGKPNEKDVNARDNYSETPLHFAARHGHRNVIEFLLGLPEGARPDVNARNNNGRTPLHIAARHGHLNVIEFLFGLPAGARPDVNARNNDDQTPIMMAFQQGRHNVVELLQRHGAVLPVHLRVAAAGPAAAVNNAQSIHTTSNHESVSESATKLLARYEKENLAPAQKALFAWVLSLDDDIKTQAAKRAIATFGNSDYVDPRSGVSFKQAFSLVWLGVNDKHALAEQALTEDDIKIRRQTLIEHLYRMQRGYNLNAAGEDNGLADKPICTPGAFSTLINTLAGGHQDVTFVYITPETINLKAEALLKETLASLTPETKAEHAKETEEGSETLPAKLLDLIKTAIQKKLHDEFLGCKGLPPEYANLVKGFCDNLEFHPLITELAKTLNALRISQEKDDMEIDSLTEKTTSTQEAKVLTFSSAAASSSSTAATSNTLENQEKTRRRARS